jgi:uncharacterized membrane protein
LGKKKKRKPASQKKTVLLSDQPVRPEPPVQKQRPEKKKKQRVLLKMKEPNWILTVLAAAGMILTAYLVIAGWLDKAPLLCNDGSSCDIVQRSRWGTLLMLPTALWGFLTYATLFYIGFKVRNIGLHWKSAWTISMIGLGYSIYLISISMLVIEAACAYCIASFIIMSVIFGVVTYQRPKNLPKSYFIAFAKQTVVIAVVIVGGIHLYYSGVFDPKAGPEDPYLKGLAEHLTEDKAILYGAYW